MSEDKNEKNATNEVAEKDKDVEQSQVKYKYPMAIPFIISNEFCERFNFYGMKAILVIYLTQQLLYDADTATMIYHIFNASVYFFCIFGAIIADSWWGKFKTILWLSIVYVVGSVVIAIGAIEDWNLPARLLTILGLFLIALGSGGIKPCVAAFGGEQFTLPQQAAQLAVYFSAFYFSVNAGSLVSTTVTPILREDLNCFGVDGCYPLAFGLPAILMATSIVIFLAGKFLYKILPNQGNMLVKVCGCIYAAIKNKKTEKTTNPKEHWLEYAESTHGKKLVLETKILLNVLVLYLPLPFFWALFDQQGSRWTFQATRMTGDLGFVEIKPDQMQVINPLLILLFIPLYEMIFYPLLAKIGVRRPLQKLTIGGILAGVAFVVSAIVEINLEDTYAIVPKSGQAQIRIYNGRQCDYTFNSNIPEHASFAIKSMDYFEEKFLEVNGENVRVQFTVASATGACSSHVGKSYEFTIPNESSHSFLIRGVGDAEYDIQQFEEDPEKSRRGWPKVRVLANINSMENITLLEKGEKNRFQNNKTFLEQVDMPSGKSYSLDIGNRIVLTKDLELVIGGVYSLLISEKDNGSYDYALKLVTTPNTMNMMWLIPQYVVITLGEVMFSITGLTFSFTQAPESMKSVLQGCWLLTVAVGNVIVVIVTGAKFFSSQTYEFFLFAGLMFVDMGVFMWLAKRYKSIPLEDLDKIDDDLLKNEDKRSELDFNGKDNKAYQTDD